jgi:hypothetical protein
MKQEQIPPKKFLRANNLEDVDFAALLAGAGGPDMEFPTGADGGTMRQTRLTGGMVATELV